MPRLIIFDRFASPHFQLDHAIAIDYLKICPIGRDEAGSMGARSESDENVKVKVPQFERREALNAANVGQYNARLEPILLRRS
jgi:hypothetical protein